MYRTMKNNPVFTELDDIITTVFDSGSGMKKLFGDMGNLYYNFDTFKTKRKDNMMMLYYNFPMVNKEDINIEITDVNEMVVTATISDDNPFYSLSDGNKQVKYKYMIGNKSDMDNIKSTFKDGVLMIEIPDKKDVVKTIEIK